eukprot:gene27030-biopygen17597
MEELLDYCLQNKEKTWVPYDSDCDSEEAESSEAESDPTPA